MGLDFHSLVFLASAVRRRPLGRTATIGRLQYFAQNDTTILKSLIDAPFEKLKDDDYCEPVFRDLFGASLVDSFDASDYEGATFVHDFNKPIEEYEQYDAVLDFGTLEHIFDIAQALSNVMSLCRVGGRILHCLPADNWNGHGFWQFSPELFFSFYSEARGFANTEIFLAEYRDRRVFYRVRSAPSDGGRLPILSRSPTYILVRTTRVGTGEAGVQQSDYAHTWSRSAASDADARAATDAASLAPASAPPPRVGFALVERRLSWLEQRLRANPQLERRLRQWKNSFDYVPYLLTNPMYFFRDEARFEEILIEDLLRRDK